MSSLLLIGSPVAAGTIVGTFGIGACGSLLGITIQAHLAERQQARRAQAIAELNLASSACAVLASIAIGAFERTEIGWRGALLAAIVGLVLVGAIFRQTDINPAVPIGAGHRGDGRRLPGAFWAYAAVIFLGVSVDWCVAFWGADFLEQRAGLSRANAAGAMSAFFVAILIGRFGGSRLATRLDTGLLLRGSLLTTGTGFLVFWLAPAPMLAILGLFVLGLGTANVYPFAFTAALDVSPGRADSANARLTLCGGAAVLILPFVLGLLADVTGIERALGIVPPLLMAAVAIALVAGRRSVH